MSIATQIQRLDTAKQEIKTSIEGKGVAVPDSATLSDYPLYIDQIESGGGGVTGAENLVNPQFNEWGLLKGDVIFKDSVTYLPSSDFQNYASTDKVTSIQGGEGLTDIEFYRWPRFSSDYSCNLQKVSFKNASKIKFTGSFYYARNANNKEQPLEWDFPNIEDVNFEELGQWADLRTFPFDKIKRFTGMNIGSYAWIGDSIHFDSIEEIYGYYFSGEFFTYTDLKDVYFGENLRLIEGYNLFSGYRDEEHKLTLHFKGVTPPQTNNKSWISDFNSINRIYVPCGSAEAYKQEWPYYGDKIVEEVCYKAKVTVEDSRVGEQVSYIPLNGSSVLTNEEVSVFSSEKVTFELTEAVDEIASGCFNDYVLIDELEVKFDSCITIADDAFEGFASDYTIYAPLFCISGYEGKPFYDHIQKSVEGDFVAYVMTNAGEIKTFTDTQGTEVTQDMLTNALKVVIGTQARSVQDYVSRNADRNMDYLEFYEGVEEIKHEAFDRKNEIKNDIVIPSTLKTMGFWSFLNCKGITSMTFLTTTPPGGSSPYEPITDSIPFTIYVPDASIEQYRSAEFWSNYSDRYVPLSEKGSVPTNCGMVINTADGKDIYVLGMTNGTFKFPDKTPDNFEAKEVTILGKNIVSDDPYYFLAYNDGLRYYAEKVMLPNFVGDETEDKGMIFDKTKCVELGSETNTIPHNLLIYFTGMETLVIRASNPPTYVGGYSVSLPGSVQSIYVPDGSVDTYKSTYPWSNLADKYKPLSEYNG